MGGGLQNGRGGQVKFYPSTNIGDKIVRFAIKAPNFQKM